VVTLSEGSLLRRQAVEEADTETVGARKFTDKTSAPKQISDTHIGTARHFSTRLQHKCHNLSVGIGAEFCSADPHKSGKYEPCEKKKKSVTTH